MFRTCIFIESEAQKTNDKKFFVLPLVSLGGGSSVRVIQCLSFKIVYKIFI